jgi:hypothetical protein
MKISTSNRRQPEGLADKNAEEKTKCRSLTGCIVSPDLNLDVDTGLHRSLPDPASDAVRMPESKTVSSTYTSKDENSVKNSANSCLTASIAAVSKVSEAKFSYRSVTLRVYYQEYINKSIVMISM